MGTLSFLGMLLGILAPGSSGAGPGGSQELGVQLQSPSVHDIEAGHGAIPAVSQACITREPESQVEARV